MKKSHFLIIIFFLFLVAVSSLFFAAKSADEECWWKEKLTLGFLKIVYPVNCDSVEFVRLTATFPGGYSQNPLRINRPLYPALNAPFYQLIKPILSIPDYLEERIKLKMEEISFKKIWEGISPQEVTAAWGASVVTNFYLSFLAIYFLFKTGQRLGLKKNNLPLALLMVFSIRFKDYLLSPHTQMFDYLIPAYLIYLASFWLKGGKKPIKLWELFFLGMILLGKNLYFAIPIAFWLLVAVKEKNWLKYLAPILPTAFYIIFLWFFKIPYYSHEMVSYREGIWLFDAWRQSGLINTLPLVGKQAFKVLKALLITLRIEFFFLLALIVLKKFSWKKYFSRRDYEFMIVYFLSWLGFFILVGYFEPPITYTFFPVLFLATGRWLKGFSLKTQNWLLLILFLLKGWLVYG